ncbi:hypothetical protein PR048_017740 [Dryococelus australis]|uniref:DENR N-terminal domain-containing protein n=1 Tax=Dryococelus australis TaxID=614101 RepID=A0ABQ9HAG6_9NEOP|nr:hypothetical protein PR048_017740 [Dryococelus australis]
MSDTTGGGKPPLPIGPLPRVSYPITVQYCGNCTMPIEYCEYYPEYEKCKQWLEKNLPTEFEKVMKLGKYGSPYNNFIEVRPSFL